MLFRSKFHIGKNIPIIFKKLFELYGHSGSSRNANMHGTKCSDIFKKYAFDFFDNESLHKSAYCFKMNVYTNNDDENHQDSMRYTSVRNFYHIKLQPLIVYIILQFFPILCNISISQSFKENNAYYQKKDNTPLIDLMTSNDFFKEIREIQQYICPQIEQLIGLQQDRRAHV